MRWEYGIDPPGPARRILLDGEAIPKVRGFDTDEGWVRALCLEDHTGEGGRIHFDRENPGAVCEWVRHGVVTVEAES